jgi:hypothetical protein
MTPELDLAEFTQETIDDLGIHKLQSAHPWIAYTLGFIYQNKSETADLEGVFEIEDRVRVGAEGALDRHNVDLFISFMLKASRRTPASAAMLASHHLASIMANSMADWWLENLSSGFMHTGVTERHQVEAICKLLAKVNWLMPIEPDNRMFDFRVTHNRDHFLIMLVLARNAVERGVLPLERNLAETLKFLDDIFCTLTQPGGFSTLNRLSHQFLTHQSMRQTSEQVVLTDEQRSFRLNEIVNPLFRLYVNTAHRVQHFETQSYEIFTSLSRMLRTVSAQKPHDVLLFNHEAVRQMALRTLMASEEVWKSQLKRRPGRGQLSADTLAKKIEHNLSVLMMDLDSLSYEGEKPLQKAVFNRLYDVIVPWVSKLKDTSDIRQKRLLDLLCPHVDFESKYTSSRGLTKGLLDKYIVEERRDLLGMMRRKDRGRLIEDELGL